MSRKRDSSEGAAYDRVQYASSMTYGTRDAHRALSWAGTSLEASDLSEALFASLGSTPYPLLASNHRGRRDPGGWSSILHFYDPSYPLFSWAAAHALGALGYELDSSNPYPAYVRAIDDLKERCPAWAVPETHWFLSRVIQVGLEACARPPESKALSRRRPDRSSTVMRA